MLRGIVFKSLIDIVITFHIKNNRIVLNNFIYVLFQTNSYILDKISIVGNMLKINYGGQNIRKQLLLFITLITFLMFVTGAVCAGDADAFDNDALGIDSASYSNAISSSNNDINEQVYDSQSSNILKDSGSGNTTSVEVKVNYQYSDDANKLVPDFYVVSNGKYLNFTKNYNVNDKNYVLNIKDALAGSYNITAMTSGYVSQSKIISGADLTNLVSFDLKATKAYELGKTVTESADKLLDFKNADDILIVTSAGVAKLYGKCSEEAIEGIINYGNHIAYTDVLMLRQSAVDPIDFAFITKKGNQLKAAIFENGSTKRSEERR